jgi:hypothetical protein
MQSFNVFGSNSNDLLMQVITYITSGCIKRVYFIVFVFLRICKLSLLFQNRSVHTKLHRKSDYKILGSKNSNKEITMLRLVIMKPNGHNIFFLIDIEFICHLS